MPPQSSTPPIPPAPERAPAPPHVPERTPSSGSSGPIVGVIIIVILMIVGGLYFWGQRLNQQDSEDQLPLIPADSSMDSINSLQATTTFQ